MSETNTLITLLVIQGLVKRVSLLIGKMTKVHIKAELHSIK